MLEVPLDGKQLIIFDFDGLLVNSEEVIQKSWGETCRHLGISFPDKFFDDITGISKDITIKNLESYLGYDINHEYFFEVRSNFIDQAVDRGDVHLLGGVKNFLGKIRDRDIPMGICTSSSHDWPKRITKLLDIDYYFEFVFGNEDVDRVKPYPDLYLKALKNRDIPTSQAIIFEDSLPGILAGHAAGIDVVAINSNDSYRHKIKEKSHPKLLLSSFEEFDVAR